jgi:hypothetical protein
MLRYLTTRQLKSTDAIYPFSEREKTISALREVAEDDSGRFESFACRGISQLRSSSAHQHCDLLEADKQRLDQAW